MIRAGMGAAAFKRGACVCGASHAKAVRRMGIEDDAGGHESPLRTIREARARENAEVRLGAEPAGSCPRSIAERLAGEEWVKVCHANPILTGTRRQRSEAHRAENGRIDAEGIAEFPAAGASLVPYAPLSCRRKQARETCREIVRLSDGIAAAGDGLGSLIRERFPEFPGVFKRVRPPLPLWALESCDLPSLAKAVPNILPIPGIGSISALGIYGEAGEAAPSKTPAGSSPSPGRTPWPGAPANT